MYYRRKYTGKPLSLERKRRRHQRSPHEFQPLGSASDERGKRMAHAVLDVYKRQVWDGSKGSTDYRNSSRKCAVLYGNPVAACSGGFAGRSRDNSGRKNVFLPDCSTLVGTAMLSGQKPGRNEACLDLLYVLCLRARRRLQRHF